jgi:chlorite dismutase
MASQRPHVANIEPSLQPTEGWHCVHHYYRFDRARLASDPLPADASDQFVTTLAADTEGAPTQLQAFIVGGDKADFGVMLLDPDPLKIDSIHQRLISGPLGAYLRPAYSFVSMTEVSEYVPTLEQYGDQLVEGGVERDSEMFTTKLNAYQQREPMMRKQRLTPDLPAWPAMCFYPMNKKRKVGENWFTEPFAARKAMMSEHAKSGMAFAGKVTQLITVSVGLDDWEWGVTLWAKNPEFLKEIVYKMRFDEASARYAEFGPFYVGYVATAQAILAHCRVG